MSHNIDFQSAMAMQMQKPWHEVDRPEPAYQLRREYIKTINCPWETVKPKVRFSDRMKIRLMVWILRWLGNRIQSESVMDYLMQQMPVKVKDKAVILTGLVGVCNSLKKDIRNRAIARFHS